MTPPEIIANVAAGFWPRLSASLRLLGLAAFVVSCVGAVSVGRLGTPQGRLIGALLLLVGGLSFLASRLRFGAHSSCPQGALFRIIARIDPAIASRLLRASRLVHDAGKNSSGVSLELARVHFARQVAVIPVAECTALGLAFSRYLSAISFLLAIAASAIFAADPYRAAEGLNVIFAYRGRAPLHAKYVELLPSDLIPPAYLREPVQQIDFDSTLSVAKGSQLVVRGLPELGGRQVVLTDGKREVPFVSDGHGGISARYNVMESVRLQIGARFGAVLITQPSELEVLSVSDEPPEVELEQAPSRIPIAKLSEIELHYHVRDDHALRLVELHLRAGVEQEQRRLIELRGETKRYTGVYLLKLDEPFIVQSSRSIELTIVARDGNAVDGPQASKSKVIVLDKPDIGTLERTRLAELGTLRDALVDWFAELVGEAPRGAFSREYQVSVSTVGQRVLALLGSEGQKVGPQRAFLLAQLDKLSSAKAPANVQVAPLKEALISIDAFYSALAMRDAALVSRQLGGVALELELAAKDALIRESRTIAVTRMDESVEQLERGIASLLLLGDLGADLGQVAQASVHRIRRLRARDDFANVVRAAAFLSERLKRPMPSFTAGLRPTVESGVKSEGAPGKGGGSEAETRFQRIVSELRQLAQEHRNVTDAVAAMVEQSEQAMDSLTPLTELERRKEILRSSVAKLPNVGADPGTATALQGLAKELTYGAADSLVRRNLRSALDGLRQADDTLVESTRAFVPERERDTASYSEVTHIRKVLKEQQQWVLDQLRQVGQRGPSDVAESLRQLAGQEKELSERTRAIATRETKDDAVLPSEIRQDLEQAGKLMSDAEKELKEASAKTALPRLHQAQALLERSEISEQEPRGANSSGQGAVEPSGSRGTEDESAVTPTSDVQAREQFRKRVLEGLKRDETNDASASVRRYAEGLLK